MTRTRVDLNGQSDLPLSEANLKRLGDNSQVDDLHRHSKLVAPDGAPDPALYIDNDGKVGIGTTEPNEKLDIGAGNIKLDNTTFANQNGIIKKNNSSFIHNFNYGWNGTVTTNGNNIFVGENAGNFTMGSTATLAFQASCNTGIGVNALSDLEDGCRNVGIGYGALEQVWNGYFNVGIGAYAGSKIRDKNDNTAIGYYALSTAGVGGSNVAIGAYSLKVAANNSACNMALGANALREITNGDANIGVGMNAGWHIADGSPNQTPNQSIYIGSNTEAYAAGGTNEIVIGYETTGNGSNTVTLGNDNITITALKGNVGIGTTNPSQKLEVAGNVKVDGALEITEGLKLPKEPSLAVNSKYALGECWIYEDTGNARYYLAFKDADGSAKAVELNVDVTLT